MKKSATGIRGILAAALTLVSLCAGFAAEVFTVRVGSPSAPSVVNGEFDSVVASNVVELSGTNTLPGSTRVTVNGTDAEFDAGSGSWARLQPLVPGLNRLIIHALDGAGSALAVTNKDVVSELSSTFVGDTLGTTSTWTPAMGVIRLTNYVAVPSGGNLTIAPGTVVLASNGFGIHATNASLVAAGTVENPIYFLPADGTSIWGGLLVSGSNGVLTLQHVETVASPLQLLNGAVGLLEDSRFRDYTVPVPPIVYAENAAPAIMRRCHVIRFYETHWVSTRFLIEDCLLEYMSYTSSVNSDGIDLDSAPAGSVIRRCTLRHAPQTNIDGVDTGTSIGTVVENCLMYNLSDKGVSIGENSLGIVVRNCLMYGVDSGVAVKDGSTAELYNDTVSGSDFGFRAYQKTAGFSGAQVTNSYNNILWGNTNNVTVNDLSTLEIRFSDIGGTNFPGNGNINSDPLFLNPAQRDYRPATNSPIVGSGQGGGTMGANFPVGAPMASSHPRFESIALEGPAVILSFYADSEKSYSVQSSGTATGGTWTKVTNFWLGPYPQLMRITNNASAPGTRFYRLVTPQQP